MSKSKLTFNSLEWYNKHLPDGMCAVGSGWFGMFSELLTWLMGFEALCYALNDHRDLVRAISERLIEDVKIDAKHSFEDIIEGVRDAKRRYGDRIAVLGDIDVDFLCRQDEEAVRARVRYTLDVCLPGGGYCLGTGNSVANYIPLENFLTMLDEGRRYSA